MEPIRIEPAAEGMRPYLRDATIAVVPRVSDEGLERIEHELRRLNPFALTRRLSDAAIVVEGIPVYALGPHDADAFAWAMIKARVDRALASGHGPRMRVTSIDVRDAVALLA